MEIGLGVAPADSSDGSRIGGPPPEVFEGNEILSTHDYLFTLASGTAPWLGQSDLSVFVRRGFGAGDSDRQYPDIAVQARLHPASPRSSDSHGKHPFFTPRRLAVAASSPTVSAMIRIAESPSRIQHEPSDLDPVLAAGYRFLFSYDEEGLPIEEPVVSEYLLGYGAVHFFGRLDADGQAREIVAGLIENS